MLRRASRKNAHGAAVERRIVDPPHRAEVGSAVPTLVGTLIDSGPQQRPGGADAQCLSQLELLAG